MWARMNTTGACRRRWRAARRRRGPTTARIPTIMAVTPMAVTPATTAATTAATIRMPTAQASASALASAVEAGAAALTDRGGGQHGGRRAVADELAAGQADQPAHHGRQRAHHMLDPDHRGALGVDLADDLD